MLSVQSLPPRERVGLDVPHLVVNIAQPKLNNVHHAHMHARTSSVGVFSKSLIVNTDSMSSENDI